MTRREFIHRRLLSLLTDAPMNLTVMHRTEHCIAVAEEEARQVDAVCPFDKESTPSIPQE